MHITVAGLQPAWLFRHRYLGFVFVKITRLLGGCELLPRRPPDCDAGAQGEQGLQELNQRDGQDGAQIQLHTG